MSQVVGLSNEESARKFKEFIEQANATSGSTKVTTPGGRIIDATEPSHRSFEDYQKDVRKQERQITAPIKRNIPKLGRNHKCPCGSQKKIKHCTCRMARMFM